MAQQIETRRKVVDFLEDRDGEDFFGNMFRHTVFHKVVTLMAKERLEGTLKGAMLSWPIADGSALYRVVSEKPLKLEHLPLWDGYAVPHELIRGTRRVDLEEKVYRDQRLSEFFAAKAPSTMSRQLGDIRVELTSDAYEYNDVAYTIEISRITNGECEDNDGDMSAVNIGASQGEISLYLDLAVEFAHRLCHQMDTVKNTSGRVNAKVTTLIREAREAAAL